MKYFTPHLMLCLLLLWAAGGRAFSADTTNAPDLVTARDFYNAGTKLLAIQKFADAERMFLASLAAQDERVQPPALFNLGHVRYADGWEIFKKGPDAQKVSESGQSALAGAENAARSGETALADNQMDRMISAYLKGRGAQRQLRTAEKAVKEAMKVVGKTLTRWQRADDDFKGAAELDPADTNATHNAELVEQDIARLVDLLRRMQQMDGQMAGQKQQLGKTLSKLKGQIPAPDAPPGGKGDDDEEGDGGGKGDVKPESLIGKMEDPGREGQAPNGSLSPDQAGQLLDGLPVDGSRRLPVGDQQGPPMKDRNGRNW